MKTLHTIYTNFAKRIAVVLTLLFALGVTSVWGETVTFVPSDFSGQGTTNTGSEMSSTKNGVTFSCDKGFGTTQIRCYKGSTITINSSNIITDISFTFSGNDYNGDLSTTTTALYSGLNTNNWTQKLSAEQARITQCVITYTISGASTPDPEPDPTTTYSINWHTSTSTCISNTVTANSTIQKPETDPTMDGYTFRGWTDQCEIASNGSNFSPITNFGVAQADKDYYAVFAIKTEGGSDIIDIIDNNVTKNNLGSTGTSSWVGLWQTETLASGAKYSIRSMGINNATDYALQWNANAYLYTSSKPQEGLKLKSLTVKTQDSESIKLFGSASIYTGVASTTALATLSTNSDGATYSLTPEQLANNYTCIGINGNSSSTKVISISITYSAAASYDKYITTCTNEVIITLDPNGGTGNFAGWDEDDDNDNYTKTVEKENSVTLPNILEKTGYTFQGWSDGENTYTGQYAPTANVTLTASWKAIDYDITYYLNGGTNHASNPNEYTIETSTITLQTPAKIGYTFGGWYKENTFENKVTQIINGSTGDITLYAKWTPNPYTVQFNANEGTGTMSNQPFTYDVAQNLSENTYTRTGYNFTAWNTAADGTGTPYADKAGVKNLTAEPNGEITLYAQWTAKKLINYRTLCTYNIEYTNLEGTTHSNPVTYTAANLPLEFIAPSAREGYTFKGWDPATLSAETRGDQVVEAQWAANTYSVIFNANGGTGTMEKQQFTYDVEQALSANQFTRVGYTFAGWNDNASGNSTSYTDQQVVKNLSSAKNGQRTLYAQWTANTNTSYVVKHYKEQLDGTYLAEADDTDNLTGTTAASVTPAVKSYEGFTAPSTQTVSIAADGSTVVTYLYTRNSYKLTWDLAGGTITTEGTVAGSVKYEAPIIAPTVAKTGYNFISWSPEVPATMPAGDVTYTAQWQLIQYTITWSVGGSTTTSIVSVETPLSLPTNPANDALGCCADAFIGWSVYAQPTKEQVFIDVADAPAIDGNKTFHAVFATTILTEGSAAATFNEMGYANAEKVTEIALGDGEGHGDATILFAKEQSAPNYPAYYTASGALHAYAKNTITINSTSATSTVTNVQFTFAAKEDGSNTISANVGTYADGTWSGSAESVVFTIGGETGHRKITSITVTTQAVEQYTNYVTKCTYGNSPTLGDGTITYNSGDGIDVRCEQTSAMNSAATLTFPNAADLTCPITLTASEGFLISTSKSNDAGYQTFLTVSPYKSGSAQAGKLRTIYVRANAIGKTENYSGTITISGGEVTEQTITVNANVNCQGYTLTLKDHLGNTIGTPTSHYAGDVIANEPTPSSDACTAGYAFDGWSTSEVEYGSLIYNKVSFPYTMPAEDVTLYPVYQCNKTADYHRVTSDLGANNWAGDYLIAASSTIVADGRTSNLTQINNANIDENIVPASFGNLYYVSLIAVDGGYVLKTQDPAKPYIYITDAAKAGTPTDELTKADDYPLTIKWDTKSNIIIHNAKNTTGYTFQYSASASPARFGFFKAFPIYLYKKSSLYTTSLICGTIDIQEDDMVVTSTKDQSVKVSVPIKLTSPYNDAVTVSGANVNSFSVISKENVPVNTDEVVNVELVYSPQAYDQLETETITLTATNGATTSFQITGRSLPETFAIVAKVGNVWYALPSQGLNSTTPPAAYPVEVDDMADPTAVTAVPANADWSLRQVYASSGSNDRFTTNGENLVFVNNASPAMTLNASSSEEENYLLADAQYNNYHSTNPGLYEWTPTTTDLETYQLTNEQRGRTLSVNTATVFGVHAQNKAVEQVRFLPITGRYTPAALQVVEWKENSVVIMYNGNPAQTASVSVNGGEAQETDLSSAQRDIAVYELTATGLAANPTQRLSITIGSEKTILSIPYIISGSKNDIDVLPGSTVAARQEVAKVSDLVILKGATLTAAGASNNLYKFRNVTIYGGGKLVIPFDKGFGVNTLTLRIGGMTEDNKYDYVYPEFVLNGKYTSSSGKINLDYVTTKEQYYTFVAPFDVNTKDIKYPVDIYGNNVAANNTGSFEFQYYDGAARAAGERGWKVLYEDPTNGATLTAHKGYTFYGMPRKVSVNGGTSTRQKFGIHRIPMTETAAKVMSHENSEQKVTISAHPSEKNINSGWNLIGNPYMSTITGLNNESIVTGTIVLVDDRWQWSNEADQYNHRFIVFPSNDGEWYYTSQASNATLPAFKNFFVQIIDKATNALVIPHTSRTNPSAAPARRVAEDMDKDIELAIVLEQDDKYADQMDFLLNDAYSAVYDRNADFTKMMNNTNFNLFGVHMDDYLSFVAIDTHTARSSVAIGYQVPQAGQYTLRLSDKPYVMWSMVDAIYVTDHEVTPEVTTNLLDEAYTFQVTNAETNTTRFSISIVPSKESGGTTTAVDDILHQDMQTQKFIYNDQLYILRGGVVYDAMGQRVTTINQ